MVKKQSLYIMTFCCILGLILAIFCSSRIVSAADTLKLGVIVPLSGAAAEPGTRMLKAIELAANDVNKSGGVLGKKIELVVWDEEAKVDKALTGAKKLIMQDKVWGLVGGYRTGVSLAIIDVSADEKVIWMITDSVGDQITDKIKENYDKYKYTFRSQSPASDFAKNGIPFLTDVVKTKKYFYVSENTQWTKSLGEALNKFAVPLGIECVGTVECDPGATEFTSEIEKIRQANPGAVICSLAAAAGPAFARQYAEARIRIPIMYCAGIMTFQDVVQGLGDKANYQCTMAWLWDIPVTPKTLDFYKRYTQYYARPGGSEDSRGYDGLMLIVEGIKKAKSFDVDKVAKALEGIEYVGVSGKFVFGKDHQPKYGQGLLEPIIVQWFNKKGYVIYPPRLANSAFKLMPSK
jgi:branched-chain amino acid transport system substrate-binding protein